MSATPEEAFAETIAALEANKRARDALKARLAARLKAKGIRLFTSACGCCDGVSLSCEIDGEMVVDDATEFNFDMFGPST